MSEPGSRANPTELVALRRRRDEVIEALSESYAADLLAMEEFEHRLDLAHRATDMESLETLLADIELPEHSEEKTHSVAIVPAESRPESKTVVAILGGASRKGEWTVPRTLNVYAVMGGADIDLRECAFAPGLTEIKVFALMGGADVIVPPNLAVECDGGAILGGFDALERSPGSSDPDAPRVRITGFALLGGVDVSTRLPGESARQARKRLKRERKKKAKQLTS